MNIITECDEYKICFQILADNLCMIAYNFD